MKRIFTALALASLFASVPAFAKSHIAKPAVVKADTTGKTDEAKPAEGEKTKPKKTTKKTPKKAEEPKKDAAPEAAPAK